MLESIIHQISWYITIQININMVLFILIEYNNKKKHYLS